MMLFIAVGLGTVNSCGSISHSVLGGGGGDMMLHPTPCSLFIQEYTKISCRMVKKKNGAKVVNDVAQLRSIQPHVHC